ncbi:GntR family transcriptional regulator [Nonomuraea sp. KM90]|uniref:GntR family transcriptional regulator n=1 Tax=Nonomuraea sp. KM90 TaxID=3457428 RepID=UPI003FCE0E62
MVALYQILAEELARDIVAGTYPPRSVLPRIVDIARERGVARETVRAAIGVLTERGLVRSVRRRGTVVLDPAAPKVRLSRYRGPLLLTGDLASWEAECRDQGLQGSVQLLEVTREAAGSEVADALGLQERAAVLRRAHRVFAQGEPVQLHSAWYPYDLVSGTPLAASTAIRDPHDVLARAGAVPAAVSEAIRLRPCTSVEATALQLPVGGCVLDVSRTTSDSAHRPVEHQSVIADPARSVLAYDGIELIAG